MERFKTDTDESISRRAEALMKLPEIRGEIGNELNEAFDEMESVPRPKWNDRAARDSWYEHPKVVRWLRIKYAVDGIAMEPGFDLNKLSAMKLADLDPYYHKE